MAKLSKKRQQDNLGSTVGVRIPDQVRRFYEQEARTEKRKLSEVLRRVLVENADAKAA